jgi:hypothetical protein
MRGTNKGIGTERQKKQRDMTANTQAFILRKTNPGSGAINATINLQWGHIAVL